MIKLILVVSRKIHTLSFTAVKLQIKITCKVRTCFNIAFKAVLIEANKVTSSAFIKTPTN